MNIKFLKSIIFLLFALSFYRVNAQDSTAKAPLVGIWELTNIALAESDHVMDPQNTTLKVFDSDGTLSQVIVTGKGAFILQKGKYQVVDKSHFNDILLADSRADSNNPGKTYLVEFHLIKNGNNNFLSLEGALEDDKGNKTMRWKELWRKVEVIPK
ncbi:DUF4488 domain-containing protein [Pedobacter frigidisoli]|uniref:DUF4488 domain-containing protein n=1 Tax=Pedobacter frigidisoli TaxID=2530455 RepID=A0A4R0NQ29_9SPHI|nr:DUF4488 domain-containing protein [Pedobacter frigidisoli]TCD02349.1 DUF4488 domain-containing protein [Pedobacter frigidisoli]